MKSRRKNSARAASLVVQKIMTFRTARSVVSARSAASARDEEGGNERFLERSRYIHALAEINPCLMFAVYCIPYLECICTTSYYYTVLSKISIYTVGRRECRLLEYVRCRSKYSYTLHARTRTGQHPTHCIFLPKDHFSISIISGFPKGGVSEIQMILDVHMWKWPSCAGSVVVRMKDTVGPGGYGAPTARLVIGRCEGK